MDEGPGRDEEKPGAPDRAANSSRLLETTGQTSGQAVWLARRPSTCSKIAPPRPTSSRSNHASASGE